MNRKIHFLLLSSLTLLVLVFSAVQPMIVRADDSTPPAPAAPASSGDTSSGGTSPAPASNDTQAPASTDATQVPPAAATSAPATDVAPADTPAPSTPAVSTDTAVAPATTPAPAATAASTDMTVAPKEGDTTAPAATSTLVGSVPTGTSVVVLDASSTPVPLATQTAADIVNTADPVWCPTGKTPGDSGCTAAGITTITDLIIALGTVNGGSKATGQGTIYFTSTYTANDASLDPTVSTNLSDLTNLTIRGGWNGSLDGSGYGLSGVTTFSNVPLSITNWNGDVTLYDILITGVSGNGLNVSTKSTTSGKGNIALHNVKSNGNTNGGTGAILDTTASSGSPSVTIGSNSNGNSTFNGNGALGLSVSSNGSITLTNVIADNNDPNDAHTGDGAALYGYGSHSGGTGTVYVVSSEFNGNGYHGLLADSNTGITLENVTASNNNPTGLNGGGYGAYLQSALPFSSGVISIDPSGGTSTFNGNGAQGLTIFTNSGVILKNVIANSNNGIGAELGSSHPIGGNITVDNSGITSVSGNGFNGNKDNGLDAYSTGNITLIDVIADDNGFIDGGPYADGAYLDNSNGWGTINVTSSIFKGNSGDADTGVGGRGLVAHSNHDIILTDVTASDNSSGGAELDNCHYENTFPLACTSTGTGSIYLLGNNTFDDNGFDLAPSVGLFASSNSDITLNGVTALGNGYFFGGGAYLEAGRDLSINNSVFSENCTMCLMGFGIEATSGRNASLQGVTADSNGTDLSGGEEIAIGAEIYSGGNVSIVNSDFSNQCVLGNCGGIGLSAYSGGEITLTGVTADANSMYGAELNTGLDPIITNSHFDNNGGDGLEIYTGSDNADVTINCSTANGNGGYGLEGNLGTGTLTLNGVTLNGNSSGDNDISSGALVIKPGCGGGGGKSAVLGESGSFPWNTINVPDSGDQGHGLDCSQYVGTELVLSNGDHALLPCPIGSAPGTSGSISRVPSNKLPGPTLDSKFTFVSALDMEVNPSLSGGMATVSFKIPAGKQGANFTILHWDGTNWVKVGGSANPPGYFSVQTNLTGDFVLVTQ